MGLLGFELLFRLAWGSLLVLLFISRTETSEKFVKIWWRFHFGICAGLVFMIWGQSTLNEAWEQSAYLTTGISLFGASSYCLFTKRTFRVLGGLSILLSPLFYLPHKDPQQLINFVSSALVLGPIFMGQFLGHWFLNVPNIHIKELIRITKLVFVGLFIKCVEVAWAYLNHEPVSLYSVDQMGRPLAEFMSLDSSVQMGAIGDGFLSLGFFGQLIFVSRLLWGLIAPLVLAFLVYRCAVTRSTQSATGILYAMCVMVLIGEGSALYLLIHAGLYV